MVKAVPVDTAVGMKLAYDTTVVNREKAGVLLERGHTITGEDVELLKSSGLYRVYVLEGSEEGVFESELALSVARALAGNGVEVKEGKQGSALLFSKVPGLLRVDRGVLKRVNTSGLALLITRRPYEAFGAGELIAAVDSLPLYADRDKVEGLIGELRPAVSIMDFKMKKVGAIITGTEIYEGRKQDLYTEVIEGKAKRYGWEIVFREVVPDDEQSIAGAIVRARDAGCEAIIVTGGMSVDPTDRTRAAISSVGARVVAYGIPIKPTTMALVAYWKGIPIMGISAGGIYYRDINAIDVVFTLMMAGIRLTRDRIASLGAGGLLPNFNPAFKGAKGPGA